MDVEKRQGHNLNLRGRASGLHEALHVSGSQPGTVPWKGPSDRPSLISRASVYQAAWPLACGPALRQAVPNLETEMLTGKGSHLIYLK